MRSTMIDSVLAGNANWLIPTTFSLRPNTAGKSWPRKKNGSRPTDQCSSKRVLCNSGTLAYHYSKTIHFLFHALHGSRSNFLSQPNGKNQRIEANGTTDLEGGDAKFGNEFINFTLRNIQQCRNVRDREGRRFLRDEIGEDGWFFMKRNVHLFGL